MLSREVVLICPIRLPSCKQGVLASFAALSLIGAVLMPSNLSEPGKTEGLEFKFEVQTEVFKEHAPSAVVATPNPSRVQPLYRTGSALTPEQAEIQAPFVELGAMDSEHGETLPGFLVRVGQTMDLFTRTTQHEACGVIMANSRQNAWRVRLTTNRSHLSCVMVAFDEPGFDRTGRDIHSHPHIPGGVRANAQDIVRRQDFSCGEKIHIFDERFSGVDFDHGPGYLVSRGRLLYQHGKEWPISQMAVFDAIDASQSPHLAKGGINPTLTPELAAAAWKNEDAEGVPSTECLVSSEEEPLDLAQADEQKNNSSDTSKTH